MCIQLNKMTGRWPLILIVITLRELLLQIFQGLLRAHRNEHDTKLAMTRLWLHECFRVFSDRLVDARDQEAFVNIVSDKLGSIFDQTFHNICPSKQSPVFGDYISTDLVRIHILIR